MMPTLDRHTGWWCFLAALIVTTAVYASGLSGTWLFDDYPNIVDNPGVHMDHASLSELSKAALSSPSSRFKRPLASLTFAFNYLADGLNPFWWKVTNLVIHLLNGLLMFLLARMLLARGLPVWRGGRGNPPPLPADTAGSDTTTAATAARERRHIGILAALIAGTWMVLPINLTGVLYVVQRMTSLANLFVLLGLAGYVLARIRMLEQRTPWRRGVIYAFASLIGGVVLGFTAKETAVLLPLYALLVEWLLLRFANTSQRTGPSKSVLGGFVVVLLVPLVIGLAWQIPHVLKASTWASRDFDLGTRLLSEARIVPDYIRWTLLPTPQALSFYHDGYTVSTGLLSPWTTLLGMIVIAALLVLAFRLRRRAPLVALGLALFFGAHTLTGTILPLELIYEHRNYFASFGLLLALVPLLAAPARRLSEHSASILRGLPLALPRYVLLIGLALAWTAFTAYTAHAWGGRLSLARELALRAPQSPRAQYELGRTYIVYSDYDPDSVYTKLAYEPLERSAALPHSSILAEQALIFMNARMDHPIKDKWWNSMVAKLQSREPGVQDESSLRALTDCQEKGQCELSQQRMVSAFQAALAHENRSSRLLAIYGDYAWNVMGDHALGVRMTHKAVDSNPSEPAYHITLTRMLAVQERYTEARQQIAKLETLNTGGRLDGSIANLRDRLPDSERRQTPASTGS